MPINRSADFTMLIFDVVDAARADFRVRPLSLGGMSGTSGGSGTPPGGFLGQLSQRYVAYDTTEAATLATGSRPSLVDNLNHIRAMISGSGGGGGYAYSGTPHQVDVYGFQGTAGSWSPGDHVHYHGKLVGGDLHSTFTTGSHGFVPAPVSSDGKFLRDDGTWSAPASGSGGSTTWPYNNLPAEVGYSASKGSSGSFAMGDHRHFHGQREGGNLHATFTTGSHGFVPAPTTSTGKFLKDDGTWATAGGGYPSYVQPMDVAYSSSPGSSGSYAMGDHVHFHGQREGGNLHPVFTSASSGFAPATGGSSGRYLRDDGGWSSIPATGGAPASDMLPANVSDYALAGTTGSYSRSDHRHFHGAQPGGTTHATFTTGSAGFVPAPGSATGKFLKDNGTWAVGAGGISGSTSQVAVFNSATTVYGYDGLIWLDANKRLHVAQYGINMTYTDTDIGITVSNEGTPPYIKALLTTTDVNSGAYIGVYKAKGSTTAQTNVVTDDYLGYFFLGGMRATSNLMSFGSYITAKATEDWSDSGGGLGSNMEFYTRPNTSTDSYLVAEFTHSGLFNYRGVYGSGSSQPFLFVGQGLSTANHLPRFPNSNSGYVVSSSMTEDNSGNVAITGTLTVDGNTVAPASDNTPIQVDVWPYAGTNTEVSRSDHRHYHGKLVSGDLHSVFTTGSHGFVPRSGTSTSGSYLSAAGTWAFTPPPGTVAATLAVGSAAAAGTSGSWSRYDHVHNITSGSNASAPSQTILASDTGGGLTLHHLNVGNATTASAVGTIAATAKIYSYTYQVAALKIGESYATAGSVASITFTLPTTGIFRQVTVMGTLRAINTSVTGNLNVTFNTAATNYQQVSVNNITATTVGATTSVAATALAFEINGGNAVANAFSPFEITLYDYAPQSGSASHYPSYMARWGAERAATSGSVYAFMSAGTLNTAGIISGITFRMATGQGYIAQYSGLEAIGFA